MLLWSQQQRIVNDLAISFQNLKNTHTKILNSVIDKDKTFLNPKKYETSTKSNFKFMVLWTIFKMSTPKTETLKLIASYEKEDTKRVTEAKEKIMLYQNTFKNDQIFMSSKIATPKGVLGMYKKDQISVLYVFWYFRTDVALSRIQEREVKRINFFMEYFPSIREYLLAS